MVVLVLVWERKWMCRDMVDLSLWYGWLALDYKRGGERRDLVCMSFCVCVREKRKSV